MMSNSNPDDQTCNYSLSGMCLNMVDGFEPCGDECERDYDLLHQNGYRDPHATGLIDEDEQECTACHGTGIENGDIYDPDEPPCVVCWGTGTL